MTAAELEDASALDELTATDESVLALVPLSFAHDENKATTQSVEQIRMIFML